MNIIKPEFQILNQNGNKLEDVFKHIEYCGRLSYKSHDKITKDSHVEFVNRMYKSGHTGVLEHGTIYLYKKITHDEFQFLKKYLDNKYTKVNVLDIHGIHTEFNVYITTNYNEILKNHWEEDLKYICEPTEFHEKKVSVLFVMDRIGSQSFVRHRTMNFIQESTRFCNYIKDKFGGAVSFILPCYIKEEDIEEAERDLQEAESKYFKWLNKGYKAEEARFVLPFALKTELIMTGFISDWVHFFKLRTANSAHIQARELAIPLEREMIKEFPEIKNYY